MSSTRRSDAYVRLARDSEHEAVARILTRAFARDPAMNWYGSVSQLVPDCDAKSPSALRTMRRLNRFQDALMKATILVGGILTVVAVPSSVNGKTSAEEVKKNSASEEIVAASLWLPPGKTLDMGLVILIRSGIWKVMRGWGLTGVKRILFDFSPTVERALKHSFKSHGLDRLDSWHLLEMVVDPSHQGQGYASLLMRDGFTRTSPKPVHLEATRASTRDVYARFGFEVDEEHQFGRGVVDKDGIQTKGDIATGFPEWVMTKWSY